MFHIRRVNHSNEFKLVFHRVVVPDFAVFRIDQDDMAVVLDGCHQVVALDRQPPDMLWRPEISAGLPGFPSSA
jgi:hypothetical protein